MKTPHEIKNGLECIGSSPEKCSYCAYDAEDCAYRVGRDALAYIQQLEQELAAVKRERTSLMLDFQTCVKRTRKVCSVCSNKGKPICNMCEGCDVFEWRGVCPENTEVQNGK